MLNLLQEALQYIEKQNDWIIELKSTIVVKEKSFNEMHTSLLTRVYTQLKQYHDSEQTSKCSNAVVSGVIVANIHAAAVKTEDDDDDEIAQQERNDEPMSVGMRVFNYGGVHEERNTSLVKTEHLQENNGIERCEFPTEDNQESSEVTGDIMKCIDHYKNKVSNYQVSTLSTDSQNGQQKQFISKENSETTSSAVINCSGYYGGNFSNSQVASSSTNLQNDFTGEHGQNYTTYNNATGSKRFKASPITTNSYDSDSLGMDTGNDYKQMLNCPACKTSYGSRRYIQFQRHLVQHTGIKAYDCGYCGEKFSVNPQLTHHVRKKHPGGKPFKCLDCKQTFLNPPDLRDHKMNCSPIVGKAYYNHLGVRKRKRCEEAPADTRSAISSQVIATDINGDYMFDHNSERPNYKRRSVKPFNCAVCKQGFQKQKQKNSHRCYSHDETPFKCDLCNKSFTCWKYYICHNQEYHRDVVGYDFSAMTTSLKFHVLWE